VSDAAPQEKVKDQLARLVLEEIPYEVGGHTDRVLASDYLIVSPGVPLTIPIVKAARGKGIPIFSEIEFASWICQGKIVAITGSNGKTTTTTLVGEILAAAGLDTFVCGNIGLPLAEVADKIGVNAVAVVEVSSYQMETIDSFSPFIAMILNITPDHLDRHGSLENYRKAKYRVSENQSERQYLIINREDPEIMRHAPATNAKLLYFSTGPRNGAVTFVENGWLCVRWDGKEHKIIPTDEIRIPGPHNLQNASAAAIAAMIMDVKPEVVNRVLRTFAGVEHRLEPVGQVAGVSFVNDSKATNVDSVCYALKSLSTPIFLILGGRDKGGSYVPIIDAAQGKVKGAVALGEAREKIFNALGKAFPIQFVMSMEEAVEKCFEMASPGETVLLSPGCSSFDMFDNFEHRGRVFKTAVKSLKNGKRNSQTVS
jgi:UDP-N-acetylmuramoylalanine--D-glutamate ligase